jgi:hypothetical protein
MGHFKIDCPHCGAKMATFSILFELRSNEFARAWDTFCVCGVCKDTALIRLLDINPNSGDIEPIRWGLKNEISKKFKVVRQYPHADDVGVPEGTPDNVKQPLFEANHSLVDGRYSAAAACYRKAIERSLRHVDIELQGMLNARIRQLEKKRILPESMVALLDHVRLFGNEAMHEDDIDPTKDDCVAAKEFCELFLTYTFSLPKKIEAARISASRE